MMCFEFFSQVYLSGGGSRCFGQTLLVKVSPSNLHVYLNIVSQILSSIANTFPINL
jgi:hypothetical protein